MFLGSLSPSSSSNLDLWPAFGGSPGGPEEDLHQAEDAHAGEEANDAAWVEQFSISVFLVSKELTKVCQLPGEGDPPGPDRLGGDGGGTDHANNGDVIA